MSASDADDVFEAAETDYQKHVSSALGAKADAKILHFSEKPPQAKEGWSSVLSTVIICCHYLAGCCHLHVCNILSAITISPRPSSCISPWWDSRVLC